MNTTKHDTRPSTDRIHADAVAAAAARRARLAGANTVACAQIYADTYAVVIRATA